MLNFIESFLDLKEYFNFWKIYDEEIVWHSSNKSDGNAKECWEDIEICRKRWVKHPICSWKIMENVLIDSWFPCEYYNILDCTSVDYRSGYSYEKQYVQNLKGQPQNQNYHNQVHVSRKEKGFEGWQDVASF